MRMMVEMLLIVGPYVILIGAAMLWYRAGCRKDAERRGQG